MPLFRVFLPFCNLSHNHCRLCFYESFCRANLIFTRPLYYYYYYYYYYYCYLKLFLFRACRVFNVHIMKRWWSVPQGLLIWIRECVTERLCVGTVRWDDISAGVTLVCDTLRDFHVSIIGCLLHQKQSPNQVTVLPTSFAELRSGLVIHIEIFVIWKLWNYLSITPLLTSVL